MDRDKDLKQAYHEILIQKDEIGQLKDTEKKYNALLEEHNVLIQNEKELEEKNKTLVQTYQKLTAEFESVKASKEEMEQKLADMKSVMDQYSYALSYDPVTLEEYQIYIKELEDKILAEGGFDKYEQPRRWKDYGDIIIWLEDGSSEKWADQVHDNLSKLPKNILDTLNDNGWMIILTPRSLEDVYDSGVENTVGLTIYYHTRIYLQNNAFSIDYCTIHEVGHSLDFINNFISNDKKWKSIYESEAKNSGLEAYFTESSSEYFAQVFQSCFLIPEEMKQNAPLSYEYMMQFINSYK